MNNDIENLWQIYKTTNDFIKFSDTKAAVILASNGVILSIIFTNIPKYLASNNNGNFPLFAFLGLFIGLYFTLVSILNAILCLSPRTNMNSDKDLDLLYFKDISDNSDDFEDYTKSIDNLISSEVKFKKSISKQIFQLSRIANTKFNKVNISIRLMGIGISILSFSFILLFCKL